MKKILTLLFLVISYLNYAQGNLQFNRVINHVIPSATVSAPGTISPSISGSLTIPNNKVWKIESCGYKSATVPEWSLILDNYVLFSYANFPEGANNNSYWQPSYPIWLPEGTYNWIAKWFNYGAPSTFQGASISIIEYNIVP